MKVYDVCFDWSYCSFDHVKVWANNKAQVRKIMRDQYGTGIKIRYIDFEGRI